MSTLSKRSRRKQLKDRCGKQKSLLLHKSLNKNIIIGKILFKIIFITEGLHQLLRDRQQNGPIALDCEMVGVGQKKKSALARISIVDYNNDVLYDVICRPEQEITDYRTRWSGIRPSDMQRAIPYACVREQVLRIIEVRYFRIICRVI